MSQAEGTPVEQAVDRELIVVANRLPIEPVYENGDPDGEIMSWRRAPGGLVSALDPVLRRHPSVWVGTGDVEPDDEFGSMRLETVSIPTAQYQDYYAGFSNSAIWPLYHDAVVQPEYHRHHFDAYVSVNQAFADHIGETADTNAIVWVHDYQLQLLPEMLRRIRPDLRIGFFLHIPFPPTELFAQLPWRREMLQGILGADLVGFQTHSDSSNFIDTCQRVLGYRTEGGTVTVAKRIVTVASFPIGIDAKGFEELAMRPDVVARSKELRTELGDPDVLLLGVDRLDYTKGIDIRLRAFAELLERERLDPKKTVFVLVAVPTREDVREYQLIRDEVELLVGRFNGSFSSFGAAPIRYLHQVLERDELTALYLAADAMLVTPLRDGMNLVCKEYVATRTDNTGALILSEFTGAAQQLSDAWLVNPYDTNGVEDAIYAAVTATDEERKRRMLAMRKSVFDEDVERWANEFLAMLTASEEPDLSRGVPVGTLDVPLETLVRSPHLLVCCDYDGTLAPIVEDPARAHPLRDSIVALRALSLLPNTTVAVVSGRALKDLAALSRLPTEIHLVGSHGSEMDTEIDLTAQQRRLLDQLSQSVDELVAEVPRAFVESKPSSVAVHVRRCEQEAGEELLRRVAMGPGQMPGVLIRYGKAVVELSVVHTQKSEAVAMLRHRVGASAVLFIGDDVTDESVFEALSGPDVGVKVGEGDTAAQWRVESPKEVAKLLFELCEQRERWLLGGHAAPIEEHVLLSNQHALALVSPRGSIDWFCAPDPHSPAVFARLLGDTSSGYFSIAPKHGAAPLSQAYVSDTMNVRTRWAGLTVIDYMPMPKAAEEASARIIRRISGREPAVVSFVPRPQFGSMPVTIEETDDGLVVSGGIDPMVLRSPGVDWEILDENGHQRAIATIDASRNEVVLDFRVGAGAYGDHDETEPEVRARTEAHWRDWVEQLTLPGIRREAEVRSALTLRALCHAPTGGMLAAATASLPEHIGGVRNWDYRFCWLRDAALSVRELIWLGATEEAEAFIHWMLSLEEMVTGPERLHPVYTVYGTHLGYEGVIESLPGYAGSRPVRVENAAQGQLQLDVFGAVCILVDELSDKRGYVRDAEWALVCSLIDAVFKRWREPDHGIWEIRHTPREHTHSKMMCWLAVDRAIRIAERRDVSFERWIRLRKDIQDDIEAHAWNPERAAYVAAYDLPEADAAVLQGILEGYPAPKDRVTETIAYIERELRKAGGVYRYTYDDGLPSGEGAMHICSAWLAGTYVKTGATDDALELLDAMLNAAGATGLLPEQVDPETQRGLGNHPQAYSHVGILSVARALAANRDETN